MTLDAIGNISWKMGVGNCSYHATKKRAVVSAGSNSYGYDANGNMTSRNGASISYTSYNLPSVINAGTGYSSTLFYGAFRNRYKQVAVTPSTGTETTLYVAGLWEKVTRGGLIEYRHYIGGGQGTAAIHTRRAGSQTNSDTIYVHRDHLGSPELITDSAGNEIVRPSFGAYGERRDGTDWDGPPSAADLTAIGNISRRGFTGHEHLDAVGLIHMNGRVYEPVVGRFLGVDPILAIGNSQDVNSYSYAWNSPLNVIDPSGLQDKDVTVHQCISCDSIPYYSGGMGSFFAFMDSMGWLDFRGPTIEETRSWVLFTPGDAVDAIPQNAVSDGQSFGGQKAMFGAGSESTVGRTIWPDWQIAGVTLGGLDLSQGEIEPSTRQGIIERAIRELGEAGLVLSSDIIRIDNRYAFADSLRKPLRSYDFRFEDTAKDAFATIALLNAQPRLVQFELYGGSTERQYFGLVGPFVYTIYAWAAYPSFGRSSLDTSKFIILHEIGHGRGGCGIGGETCANDYAERLLNPK